MIALFALFAAASAQLLVGAPVAGVLPSSRFTRNDWVQPGLRYNVPAVAQYNTITPGFTTLHQTSVPVVAQAPVYAAAAPVLAAPLPLIK